MAGISDFLGGLWDDAKGVYTQYIDWDNFQAEVDLERSVQQQERQTQVQTAPAPAPTAPVTSQLMQYAPWIVGGAVLILLGPKLLRKL